MKFAEIIRSCPDVRGAFDRLPTHQLWWSVILALHGKPVEIDSQSAETRSVLASGFRFYGVIYLALAGAMFVAACVAILAELPNANLLAGLLAASSVYLAFTSVLAFKGAEHYATDRRHAAVLLVTFLVSIVSYLTCFCGVCVTVAHFHLSQHSVISVVAAIVLLVLGVGSYLIEIVFVVSDVSKLD